MNLDFVAVSRTQMKKDPILRVKVPSLQISPLQMLRKSKNKKIIFSANLTDRIQEKTFTLRTFKW